MSNLVLAKSPSPKPAKSLPQKLLQPTVIAVLASLGIHGALAVILPYLGNSSPQKPAPKTVELVKLTPAELSRIPQPAPATPLGANQLQSLNQLPGLSTPYPPLPGVGSLSGLYPTNPPPNGLLNSTPSTTSSTTQKTTPTKTVAATTATTNKTKPETDKKDAKITTSTKLALTPSSVRIPISNKRENFSSTGGLPNLNLRAADYAPATPPQPPTTLYPPAPSANQTRSQAVARPSYKPPSSNQKVLPPLVNPDVSIVSSNGTNNSNIPLSPAQELRGITQESAAAPILPKPALQPNGAENSKGGSNDDYNRRTIAAMVNSGASDIKDYPAISGSQATACMVKLTGETLITAQVDSQGSVSGASVAKPSNSSIYDNAAEIAVSSMNFGAKGKPIAYQVPVKFSYDPSACGSAATPKADQNTPGKNIPTPSNTSTPQAPPVGKK